MLTEHAAVLFRLISAEHIMTGHFAGYAVTEG